jgi:hypothetical protein
MTETTKFRVGPVVREDWDSRDMARLAEFENGPNPYRHYLDNNSGDLTEAELREVIADCDWQSDPYGPNEYDSSRRSAYKRLMKKAQAVLGSIQ